MNTTERTLVLIKPDGIERNLVGEIISRFERVGLRLIDMKMVTTSTEHITKHYTLEPTWKQSVGEKTLKSYEDRGITPPETDIMVIADGVLFKLATYMTSGPIIAMIWEGAHAVKIVRKIIGGTEPLTSDMGTIRGDYVIDSYEMSNAEGRSVRNLVHASGSVKEATEEIQHWFA